MNSQVYRLIKLKSTVATVSYEAEILVQKAGVTTQVVCNKLYGQYYLLKAPELNVRTDVNELSGLINTYSGRKHLKPILTKEIQYQRITHHRDATVRHELYLGKNLTVQKMTDNLSLLLGK